MPNREAASERPSLRTDSEYNLKALGLSSLFHSCPQQQGNGEATPWMQRCSSELVGSVHIDYLIYTFTAIIFDSQVESAVTYCSDKKTARWGGMGREETRSHTRKPGTVLSTTVPDLVNPSIGLNHLLPWTVQARSRPNVHYWPSALTTEIVLKMTFRNQ